MSGPHRLAHLADALHIAGRLLAAVEAHLELDRAEAARDHSLHLVDELVVVVGRPAAAGVDRHARSVAAEQPGRGRSDDLALQVPQRDIDGAQAQNISPLRPMPRR